MTSTATVQLSEDTIDDILYCARAGLTSDLQEAISELCTSGTHTPAAVLSAAVDSNTGNTALHMAAANGHDETVKYVLDMTRSPPPPTTRSETGASETVSEAAPDAQSATAPSSASDAASTPSAAAPSAFLDFPNASKSTALHWAALNGHLSTVHLLVDAGADLTLENAAKHDALDEAERAGKADVVRFLMARLSGKTEEEVAEIEKEAKRIAEEETAMEKDGVTATQEDLESMGLDKDEGGGVKI